MCKGYCRAGKILRILESPIPMKNAAKSSRSLLKIYDKDFIMNEAIQR
jgi:hypothetical protein